MHKTALLLCVVLASACSSGQTSTVTPDTTATPSATAPVSVPTSTPVPTAGSVPTAPTPIASAVPTTEPPAALVPDAKRGEKLFADNSCTACHGNKAKPGKKNVFTMKWSDDEKKKAADVIKKGKSPMPGFGDKLSDAEVADLVAYVSTK